MKSDNYKYFNEIERIRDEIIEETELRNSFIKNCLSDVQYLVHKEANGLSSSAEITTDLSDIFRTVHELILHHKFNNSYYLISPKKVAEKKQVLNIKFHNLLKKNALKSFPQVIDLPSKGFLELDYYLFIESKQILNKLKPLNL